MLARLLACGVCPSHRNRFVTLPAVRSLAAPLRRSASAAAMQGSPTPRTSLARSSRDDRGKALHDIINKYDGLEPERNKPRRSTPLSAATSKQVQERLQLIHENAWEPVPLPPLPPLPPQRSPQHSQLQHSLPQRTLPTASTLYRQGRGLPFLPASVLKPQPPSPPRPPWSPTKPPTTPFIPNAMLPQAVPEHKDTALFFSSFILEKVRRSQRYYAMPTARYRSATSLAVAARAGPAPEPPVAKVTSSPRLPPRRRVLTLRMPAFLQSVSALHVAVPQPVDAVLVRGPRQRVTTRDAPTAAVSFA